MLLTVNNSFIESTLLSENSHISHGFSCNSVGDMRNATILNNFLARINLSEVFYQPIQIHGNRVIINPKHSSPVVADGILVFRDMSSIQNVGILTADCVPILFTDIRGRCIGAVHSGWKGTLQDIVSTMISHILNGGVLVDDIRVSIGPHIGACCYVVGEDRISVFEEKYTNVSEFAYELNGEWHLDLGRLILKQLEQCGLNRYQIDTGIFCTSCQNNMFFSYRRDSKREFGEMIAAIGFSHS